MNVSTVRLEPDEVTIKIEGEVTLSGDMEQRSKDYETVYAAIRAIEGVGNNDFNGQSCA